VVGPSTRLRSPVLVGRERELKTLLNAAANPPALAVVEGEAGVGKTRLVEELLAHPKLADRKRYVGHCEQLSEPFPLGPVVEALRSAAPDRRRLTPLAGAMRALLPELSDRLPEAPAPLGDRRAERHRLFRAVRELLDALGPTLLVLEDLHWADTGTLELVRFLGRHLPGDLVVVCTYRTEELAARPASDAEAVRVSLRPLETGEVRSLTEKILGAEDVSKGFADHLTARTGGLPFAVEEVLGLLRERSAIVHRSGVWVRREIADVEIPPALGESIRERLARLSPATQRAVQVAAVLSGPCDEELLVEVAQLSDDVACSALAEALGSGLLLEPSERRYGFRHALARDAIEAGIPSPVRRRMHLDAARALEAAQPKPLLRLAYHYKAGGKPAEWLRYAEEAADAAVSMEDHATAYRLLKDALAVDGLTATTRGRLAVMLASCAHECLAHRDAIGILRCTLEDHDVPRALRGELRVWLGWLLYENGERGGDYAEVVRALEDLEERPALAARAMSSLARPWYAEGVIADHLRWLDDATQTARRSGDLEVELRVTMDRAITLLAVGDRGWRVAVADIPEPGAGAEEIDRSAWVCNNLADAAIKVGHYRSARVFVDRALRLLTRIGPSGNATIVKCTELEVDWLVGDRDGLRDRAGSFALEIEDWPQLQAHAHAIVALCSLAEGDVGGARRSLEALVADFHGALPVLSWIAAALARIRLAEGDPEGAVREATTALDPIARKQAWMWAADVALVAVEALLAAGRRGDALKLTSRFAHGLPGLDAPAACAALAACRGLLAEADGQHQRAARILLAADRAWLALPRPYEAARARERAGCCLLATGSERGRDVLVEAMDAFRALGATWDAARVRSALRGHGVIPPNRRGRKGYGDQLSPREAEVARLAATGVSNREIATQLFVSRRTVEKHLTAAMAKLGVTARTELPGPLQSASHSLVAHE
jgi:ATP/maltotriose-dependent transcriptional regulator MalT